MDLIIKRLDENDADEFAGLLWVFEQAFEMKDFKMPGHSYLKKLLEKKEFIVLSAKDGHSVVGGLTAYILPSYYSESSEVYLYDLAVDADFQRRGVGKKLLDALGDLCRKNGFREFFVQADEIDDHALAFYQATGGNPEKMIHFNYPINR